MDPQGSDEEPAPQGTRDTGAPGPGPDDDTGLLGLGVNEDPEEARGAVPVGTGAGVKARAPRFPG